ncbi:MAG: DUF1566 domain-containing protein [Proteobacteria bacterium]|nr:DUF1566 domain-containing protein [Pseudomonadota bacterium]MBU1582164.1 DUF1566 domain-containing protein [Pseudomonadota bacterium]MBU2452344.1 DUF1566 domain-containing protein [Pseudomonadota bacterium]MBU2627485.1 DUF1566 domain-containing protein [Pseudomonadota bacterium]
MKLKKENLTCCHNCNFSLSGSEKFCPECGSKLFVSCSEPGSPASVLSSKINPDCCHKKVEKNERNIILDPDDSTLEWYIGPDRDTSWYEAIEWLNNLKLNTGDEWRMPTRRDLKGLYDNSVSSNCKIKPTSSSWFWVWTGEKKIDKDSNHSKMAWGFNFRCGLEFWGGCSESLRSRVFVVRSLHPDKDG